MDAVEAAQSGHPGTPMALAPAAWVLWNRLMRHDPADPSWPDRDRFVPERGHTRFNRPLIAPDTVNTLPPETFAAYRDHGRPEVRIEAEMGRAEQRRVELGGVGIDLADVTAKLEAEGVSKFAASYESLLKGIESKMEELAVK